LSSEFVCIQERIEELDAAIEGYGLRNGSEDTGHLGVTEGIARASFCTSFSSTSMSELSISMASSSSAESGFLVSL
jgi:hypothetical protein